MIITKYFEKGDLTHYITNNFFNLCWYSKKCLLTYIAKGLDEIHTANIIHKDYHSGNIFIDSEETAVTGDFGISKSAIDNDDNEIYGIIPYVSPEVLQGQKYTKASDIYSFGMIMWELMTGRRPFWDKIHDTDLIIEICDGFRPPIVTDAPEGYIELMKECWNFDPNKRPTACALVKRVTKICDLSLKYITKIKKTPDIGPTKTNDPGAIYKSRSLIAMINSAKSTRSFRSLKMQSFNFLKNINNFMQKDKRKFDDNNRIGDIRDNDNGKRIKKFKLNKNNDYLTRELEFDIEKDDNYSSKI
ncbi:kinase-like domain-containing protein [Glomus cerebriforme]|uniref:Kinase-like domain-containing protein n=1 Tax=Glomus cerebriforme TaxID=658196 RepID=A0A397SPJ5_9GLOM|nr:kinase-like domain-containing protein [Glomus cerebriforme]